MRKGVVDVHVEVHPGYSILCAPHAYGAHLPCRATWTGYAQREVGVRSKPPPESAMDIFLLVFLCSYASIYTFITHRVAWHASFLAETNPF